MIQCSCIKGLYDCRVEVLSPQKVLYHDFSTWMEDGYYVLPDTYTISVKTPGGTELSLSALPKASTIFTADDLGMHWFDGIYCIKAESCGEVYTKNIAVLYKVQCCVDNLLSRSEVTADYSQYSRWNNMITGINHLTEMGRIDAAQKLYTSLKIELSQFENCC